jgi:hypothetical protein
MILMMSAVMTLLKGTSSASYRDVRNHEKWNNKILTPQFGNS